MKKLVFCLIVLVNVTCQVQARHGGDSFGGAFAGGMLGGVVSGAMTAPRSSGSSGHDNGALNAVWDAMRRLEASFADEVKRLKERINELEDQVRNVQGSGVGKKRGRGRNKHEGWDQKRRRMHEGSMPERDAKPDRPEDEVAGPENE
ncbi:hypothetical protein K2X40_02240 [Candidatus Babeliales bacterium]|nr:hypothetical protein [Candidatus Babeliales bacterium]